MSDKFNIFGRINSLASDKVAVTDDQILCTGINKKLDEFVSSCLITATDVEIDTFKQNNPNTSQLFFCTMSNPISDYTPGTIYFYDGTTHATHSYSHFSRVDGSSSVAPDLFTNISLLSSQDIFVGDDVVVSYTYTSHIEAGGTLYIVIDGVILPTIPIDNSDTVISGTSTISDLQFGLHDVSLYAIDNQNHRSNVCTATINIKNPIVEQEIEEINENPT